jgi:glutamine cyclotransferase
MKKYAIIALLILVLGSIVLIPLFKNNGTDIPEMATFDFKEDIQTPFGRLLPMNITVPEGITKVEFIYNDSVFKTWDRPSAHLTYLLESHFYGVGTRMAVVRSYRSDGTSSDDAHMIRVVSDIDPVQLKASVVKEFPHNPLNYTQGLEFNEGQLFEGTGDPGRKGLTTIGAINMKTGLFGTVKNGLDATYFGEGITLFGDLLYQLTWQNGKCFVYDKKTMVLKKDFAYTGEGWGLCNDGKQLIMSDGSERIYFRDPSTFQIVRTIDVYDNVAPRTNINELEYINGRIYANIWQTNTVIVIDPLTGKVMEEIDATALETAGKNGGDVLNGIAFNPATNKLYMTGKLWNKLFEVQLTPIQ